jgi:hypothetical protein
MFCTARCHSIKNNSEWLESGSFTSAVREAFGAAMTKMMRDQMNQAYWDESLNPVTDILFERDGVRYIREAPYVPDSRFDETEI